MGYRLEQNLDAETRVLNSGVDGRCQSGLSEVQSASRKPDHPSIQGIA